MGQRQKAFEQGILSRYYSTCDKRIVSHSPTLAYIHRPNQVDFLVMTEISIFMDIRMRKIFLVPNIFFSKEFLASSTCLLLQISI